MLLKAKYDAVALTFAHRSACDLLRKIPCPVRAGALDCGHNLTLRHGTTLLTCEEQYLRRQGSKPWPYFCVGHLVMIETQTDPKPTAWV